MTYNLERREYVVKFFRKEKKKKREKFVKMSVPDLHEYIFSN